MALVRCAVPWLGLFLAFLALAAPCAAQPGENYAFLVGVRKYDPKELTSLQFTERDVVELAKLLQARGYDPRNIVLMTQALAAENFRRAPTAANVRRELDLLLAELQPNDSIVVAFSGHGVQFKDDAANYFCPIDARLKDRGSLISLTEVFAKLEKCKAQNKLLLVDACRNDPQSAIGKSAQYVELEPAGRRTPPVPPGGVAAFFSCSATQQSFEDPKLQQGVFFHYVMQGLQGAADLDQDQEVTLPELELFAIRNVQRHVRTEIGGQQIPERRGSTRGVMTLVRVEPSELLKTEITNSIGMKLRLIPKGEFVMGSPTSEADRSEGETPHRVRITKPFYLAAYEVTQREFQQVLGRNPSYFSATGDGKDSVASLDTSRCPVESVSWYDAVEFCNKLSEQENLPAYYSLQGVTREAGAITQATVQIQGGAGYRLPTEAEWEYACRAGTTTPFHFGAQLNGREANVDGNYPYGTTAKGPNLGRTTTVGKYAPNAFGLYDMHGNVGEWCQDWYDEDYYAGSPTDDPVGPNSAAYRVLRGGSWYFYARFARSAVRGIVEPSSRFHCRGFRAARTP